MNVLVLDGLELYRRAANIFIQSAKAAIEEKGRFAVALSGGETPRPLYVLLSGEFADQVDWSRTYIFFSDERRVPPGDPSSNFRMADESLLSKVPLPRENIHRMKGELEPPAAANDYEQEIHQFFGNELHFDLILLGMGADAHTASIFPGSPVVIETTRLVAAPYIPKLNQHRITLTPPVLQQATRLMFLVMGAEKSGALKNVLEGPDDPNKYPAQLAKHAHGEIDWLVDHDAALQLSSTVCR